MVPVVQAASVKEWPAPTARTRRPSAAAALTTVTTSSSVVGWATTSGAHCWLPAQFRQRCLGACVRGGDAKESVIAESLRPMRLPRRRRLSGVAGFERLDEPRHDLVDVSHHAQVGDGEDGRLAILVDGDDVLGALHPHHVLRGAGAAAGDVDRWFRGLAGLA